MRISLRPLVCLVLVLLGCDAPAMSVDAAVDARVADGGALEGDVGPVPDAGSPTDAGAPPDDAGDPTAVVMPTLDNTGPAPGSACTPLDVTELEADTTYTGRCVSVTSDVEWPANVTLVDSVVTGAAGGRTCFHLVRVRWQGGIYVRNQPGIPCGGSIVDSSISNPFGQAMRPACTDNSGNQNMSAERCTSGWTIEDSYLASPEPGMPDQHLEAMQALWDTGGFTFTNVNFFMAGPPNGTQTGDINWHGSDTTFTDCWFTGDAGFRVYAAGNDLAFIRPRFAASAGSFGYWYPPHLPSMNPGLRVECPTLLDGTPITTLEGSVCP